MAPPLRQMLVVPLGPDGGFNAAPVWAVQEMRWLGPPRAGRGEIRPPGTKEEVMLCFIPGAAFVAAAFSVAGYFCWEIICKICDVVWAVGVIAGKALLATMILVVATLAVAFIKWTADMIRRRQHAAGACNDCPFPCKGVHVPAVRERRWTKLSTYVGEPVWQARRDVLPAPARVPVAIAPGVRKRPPPEGVPVRTGPLP